MLITTWNNFWQLLHVKFPNFFFSIHPTLRVIWDKARKVLETKGPYVSFGTKPARCSKQKAPKRLLGRSVQGDRNKMPIPLFWDEARKVIETKVPYVFFWTKPAR